MSRVGNIFTDLKYQLAQLIGTIFTAQASDPLSDTGNPHLWAKTTDERLHFTDDDGTDNVLAHDADLVHLAGAEEITGAKTFDDATLLLFNAAKTFASTLHSLATAARSVIFPDAAGHVMLDGSADDISGTKSFQDGAALLWNAAKTFRATLHTAATAARSITFPDAAGNVLIDSQSNVITGPLLSAASQRLLTFAGHNNVGACTATGTKIGDTVVGVIDLASGSVSAAASFESTITVADQIQQSSVSDLSTKKYALLVVAKS